MIVRLLISDLKLESMEETILFGTVISNNGAKILSNYLK